MDLLCLDSALGHDSVTNMFNAIPQAYPACRSQQFRRRSRPWFQIEVSQMTQRMNLPPSPKAIGDVVPCDCLNPQRRGDQFMNELIRPLVVIKRKNGQLRELASSIQCQKWRQLFVNLRETRWFELSTNSIRRTDQAASFMKREGNLGHGLQKRLVKHVVIVQPDLKFTLIGIRV